MRAGKNRQPFGRQAATRSNKTADRSYYAGAAARQALGSHASNSTATRREGSRS